MRHVSTNFIWYAVIHIAYTAYTDSKKSFTHKVTVVNHNFIPLLDYQTTQHLITRIITTPERQISKYPFDIILTNVQLQYNPTS